MCEETTEIVAMINQLRKQTKQERTIEMQSCCWLTVTYYQGCIDALTDVLDNIEKIKANMRKNNGKEVE